jgi:hypothetical protein
MISRRLDKLSAKKSGAGHLWDVWAADIDEVNSVFRLHVVKQMIYGQGPQPANCPDWQLFCDTVNTPGERHSLDDF